MNTYRTDRSYLWNYRHGPSYTGPFPRLPAGSMKDFLGLRVRSRLGIAAGILLNSRWIECYSRLGFDILTYKTVRSAHRPCYQLPNWVYLSSPPSRSGRKACRVDPAFRPIARRPRNARDVTSAVCFGMPSMEPEVWQADVRRARRSLRRGQVLVVSVVGTPGPAIRGGAGEASQREALAEDYVRCARWAARAGAHVVEANYSCPNVCSAEGQVYQDPRFSRELSRLLREALPSTPFLIKAGHFRTRAKLLAFYKAVDGLADGVILVNGVSGRVLTQEGKAVFPGHERVGILGRFIHTPALENVKLATALTRKEKLRPRTLAVGGVFDEEDAADFFDVGAAAVLLGGGAALDPQFAVRMKTAHPEW